MGFARVGSNPTVVDNFLRIVVLEFQVRPCGAMDSASDFGSGGCGFESHLALFFFHWCRAVFQRWLVFVRARVTVSSSSIISTFLPVEKDTNV